jgi:hypothetical protein
MQDNDELADELKDQVIHEFENNVRQRVLKEKQKDLKKWAERADYEGILAITDNQKKTKNPKDYISNVNQN